jgi:hypothetical protein
MVNYRGSVGFGADWRDTLIGNIGWPEVEDILAGLDDLVGHGWTDSSRAVIAGWSWGGYLTLLMRHAPTASSPASVGDYAAGYKDLSPSSAHDCPLGGEPSQMPQLMAERSPISCRPGGRALLALAGEHDVARSASPCGTDRLAAWARPRSLFPTGHALFQIDERIRQTGVVSTSRLARARHPPPGRDPGRAAPPGAVRCFGRSAGSEAASDRDASTVRALQPTRRSLRRNDPS